MDLASKYSVRVTTTQTKPYIPSWLVKRLQNCVGRIKHRLVHQLSAASHWLSTRSDYHRDALLK